MSLRCSGTTLYLTLNPVLGLVAPILLLVGLYHLVMAHHATVAIWLLNWAKWLAEWVYPIQVAAGG